MTGATESTSPAPPAGPPRPPKSDRHATSPWGVLVILLFGLFTVNFTVTILTVSIPGIAEDFGTSQSTLTWVVIGPILAFGVVGPAVGKVGDLWGHRRVYLLGLGGAAAMALGSALAWNAGSLITFRVLGAIEGAATGPASFALISLVFPREQRVKALGYWAMVAAGGPVLGVVAGGPLVSAIGWRAIFVIQVPLTLAALAVAYRVLPETARQHDRTFDWVGAVLLAVAATPLLFSLNQGPEVGWENGLVIAGFVIAPTALVSFVLWERRVARPLIPLRYFGRRNFTFPIVVQTLMHAAYMGSFVLTPLLLQNLLGYDETKTGLVSVARPLAFSLVGPMAGYLTVRIGERVAAVSGAAVLVVSMLWMASVGLASSSWFIAAGLALAGVAVGLMSPAMASCVTTAVDEEDLGVAGAAQQMMIQVGLVIGIQLMQTVQVSRVSAVGEAGSYHDAYRLGAALALMALVAAMFVRPIPRTARHGLGPLTPTESVTLAEAEVAGREWGAPEGAPALVVPPSSTTTTR